MKHLYAVGIQHHCVVDEFVDGPTPNLNEILQYASYEINKEDLKRLCIVQLPIDMGEKSKILYRWDTDLNTWESNDN